MQRDGERVVTSAEANAFPANLPIGTIRIREGGTPEVEPFGLLQKVEIVRIFDYGVGGIVAPEPPVRSTPGRR